MTQTIPDLWPAEIDIEVQSPAAILRRQASQLRVRTKDALEGELKAEVLHDGRILYDFLIVAPALDGYTHSLFLASNDKLQIYPVTIWFKPWIDAAKATKASKPAMPEPPEFEAEPKTVPGPTGAREAATPKDLLELLKELLNSPYTKGIIMSLLARVNEAGSEDSSLPSASPRG